jgi:hypothetical protein
MFGVFVRQGSARIGKVRQDAEYQILTTFLAIAKRFLRLYLCHAVSDSDAT